MGPRTLWTLVSSRDVEGESSTLWKMAVIVYASSSVPVASRRLRSRKFLDLPGPPDVEGPSRSVLTAWMSWRCASSRWKIRASITVLVGRAVAICRCSCLGDSPRVESVMSGLKAAGVQTNIRDWFKKGSSFHQQLQWMIFEVFKDIALFLRKVYLKEVHQGVPLPCPSETAQTSSQDKIAIDILTSLANGSDDEQNRNAPTHSSPWKSESNLPIKSTKIPPFRNNPWLGIFLDLVQEDLTKL